MARTLMKAFKVTEGATAAVVAYNSTANLYTQKLTSAGVYIKTGGTSRIDPSRLIFVVQQNSSKCTTAGILSAVSGSTAGKNDYFPGGYSTLNNLNITIPVASGYKANGISGLMARTYISIADLAKYMDTDQYIKFNVSTKISSVRNAACSLGSKIIALYVPKAGH
jgi:hypothetical protein